ncbi:hypothetical protein CEUSTIGMA_g6341.t1 [Chlamydomonas eustigma]|uniref:Nuclear nucleic acid-binding protein C1D n=1 Tax=Chlamydomonas eustigma TaxID=1157962 RepID=A0A250X7N9_9CHLO|nr:hypothetical protein CEUSTIGMA_g6341.t1 [Chlamydomonas eustigma]|eukprot:GAX78902.1 hypothetical protein CEUSTIGMA_g6341.t1 [Chlamydomonas eustigma]
MEISVDVQYQLSTFQKAADKLNLAVQALLSVSTFNEDIHEQDVTKNSSAYYLEKARSFVLLAKCLHALTAMVLKAKAIDTTKGFAVAELERIAQYEKKVAKAESEDILRKGRSNGALDIAVANRFINHSIPDLTPEQRKRLKQVTTAFNSAAQQQEGGLPGQDAEAGVRKRAAASPLSHSVASGSATGAGQKRKMGTSGVVSARDAAVQFLEALRSEPASGIVLTCLDVKSEKEASPTIPS